MLIILCWDFRESKGNFIPVSFPFTRQKKTMSFCIFLRTNLGRPKNLESALQDQQTVTAFFFSFCFSESELLLMFIHPFLNVIFLIVFQCKHHHLKKIEETLKKSFFSKKKEWKNPHWQKTCHLSGLRGLSFCLLNFDDESSNAMQPWKSCYFFVLFF